MSVYLNGRFLPKPSASISADDRGFIFGDGIYEVFRAVDGRLLAFDRHMRRLTRGLTELAIHGGDDATPITMRAIAERLLDENALGEGHATVYVQITRGAAPRTHFFPPADVPATVYATATRLTAPPGQSATGVRAITVPDTRWLRCDIKTIQLLPNILAKQAAVAAGAFEAILVRDGVITEGSSTSIFAVLGDVLYTHPATTAVLPGVRREMVLELAEEQGMEVRERAVRRDQIPQAEELFLTSTTNDVLAIVQLDDLRIGDGRPGTMTRSLRDALRARLATESAPAPTPAVSAGNASLRLSVGNGEPHARDLRH
ncbi:MAG: aminotransferase class IV [Gemmatimonadaceae bacterium]